MARTIGWFKLGAAALLIAGLGATAALVALKVFLPEPKLRAMVLDAARKQLGREVKLAKISAGLTGLHLRGLEISERPDFSAGAFLSVEAFSVRPSWRALIKRRLVIATATADGLSVRVTKSADGAYNYSTLASSAPAGAAVPPKTGEPAPEFDVRSLRVRRGRVEYRDEGSGEVWSISDLALSVDGFGLSDPFGLDLSLRAKGKAGARPVDAALTFNGKVDPARGDPAKFAAEFKRLVVEQDGFKLAAKGRIKGLDAVQAELEAALSSAGKTLLKADGEVKAGAPGAGGRRSVEADLKLETPGLDTTLLAKLAPGSGIPALSIPAADAALSGRWEGETATLKNLRLSWSGGKAELSGAARGLGTPKAAYEGKAKFAADLPEIRSGQYPFIKLPPKAFVPAMRLDGEASYAADEVKLSPLKAKFKQGTFSAAGSVRKLGSAKPVPDLVLNFDLDLPAIKAAELPVTDGRIPAGLVLPSMLIQGAATVKGDDLAFDRLMIRGKSGTVRVNGLVAKALAGTPDPNLDFFADLDLPALTDKDLPFPGVPAGLELPASKWNADLSYTPKAVRLRRLGVVLGSNEVTVEGGVSDPGGRGAFDLLVKCRKFVLDELTRLTPKTRDLKLTGGGFFALSVTGTKEKPVFGGKLQFKGLGATVEELPLSDFTGTVSFDERRIDVPNLSGRLADGKLDMDLTIKEYARSPEIQLEATLDRFDMGKFFAAQKKVSQERAAAKAAKAAKTGKPQDEIKPLRTRGRMQIGALTHPNATVEKTVASWDLYGLTPDLRRLNGDAKLDVGGGRLRAIGDLATTSPIVKVLVFPILVVQKIGRIGGISLFPDLNDIAVRKIVGDYSFKDGRMTVIASEMDSSAAQVSAKGSIDLPSEELDLTVTAQVGNVAPIDLVVSGTVEKPKSKVKLGKFLATPAKQLIDGLIGR